MVKGGIVLIRIDCPDSYCGLADQATTSRARVRETELTVVGGRSEHTVQRRFLPEKNTTPVFEYKNMVRFEEKLASNIVELWADYYINYRKLKKLLYNPESESPIATRQSSLGDNIMSFLQRGRKYSRNNSLMTTPIGSPSPPSSLMKKTPLLGVSPPARGYRSPFANFGMSKELSEEADQLFKSGSGDEVEQYFFEIESLGQDCRWGENIFRRALIDEINKAERFYLQVLAEVEQAYELLVEQTSARTRSDSFDVNLEMDVDLEDVSSPELLASESLRRAFGESSKKANYLQNFCILNYTAVIKILKKHDKVTDTTLVDSVTVLQESRKFMAHTGIDQIIRKHEKLYADHFHRGNLELARGDLLLKRNNQEQLVKATGARGCLYGVVTVLVVWVVWDIVVDLSLRGGDLISKEYRPVNMTSEEAVNLWRTNEFPVYRGLFYFVFWMWCWGVSLGVWQSTRINYLYMLELDPRSSQESTDMYEVAARHTIVIISLFLLHFKMMSNSIGLDDSFFKHPGYVTFALVLYCLWHVVRSCFQKQQRENWRIVFHTATPCCRNVTFMMNFAGDVLTSMTKPMVDLTYVVCYTFTGMWKNHGLERHNVCHENYLYNNFTRLLLVTPYFIRFCQQVRRFVDEDWNLRVWKSRNIANALKYASGLVVQLFAIYSAIAKRPFDNIGDTVWIFSLIVATLYFFYWDLFQDWSMFSGNGCELRHNRMYTRPCVYYLAAAVDFTLRFFWISTLLPNIGFIEDNPITVYRLGWVSSLAPGLEIIRRTMWSFIRLENEHLNNTAGYRRVTSIPLHFKKPVNKKPTLDKSSYMRILTEVIVVSFVVIALSITAIIVGADQGEN